MAAIKLAFYGAITALGVSTLNWILDAKFITGFMAGWWFSNWFH